MFLVQLLVVLVVFQLVVLVHQLGHLIALMQVGIDVEVFCIGVGPSKTFSLPRLFPGIHFEICAVPFGVYKIMAPLEKRKLRKLSSTDQTFVSASGALFNLLCVIAGYIVYLALHRRVAMRLPLMTSLALLFPILFLFRKDFGKWIIPFSWVVGTIFAREYIRDNGMLFLFKEPANAFVEASYVNFSSFLDFVNAFRVWSLLYAFVSMLPLPYMDGGRILSLILGQVRSRFTSSDTSNFRADFL